MNRTCRNLLLLLLVPVAPAMSQTTAYSVPGSLGAKRLSSRDVVMRSYQDARWQVGFLHLDPQLAITDLGYVSNIYSSADDAAESDFKAQTAAGLRGFFNLGPKVLVSPFATLGYTWWRDQSDLRSANESYGVQLFGDFNRLQFHIQGGQVETQRNLSSELEVPVDRQTDRLQAGLDLDFWGPFRFFATALDARARHSGEAAELRLPGLDLSLLDVDEEVLNAGIAYELGNGLAIGLGYEEAESIFRNDPDGRSNRGSGPLVRLGFDGTRTSLEVEVARRDLEFDARSGSNERRQTVGLGRLVWRFSETLSASLYSATRLDASALDSSAIFEGRRSGLRLQRQAGPGTRVGVFYEVGEDEFATVTSDRVTRLDDFTSYGANLSIQMTERLTVELGFFDTRRESSDPEFDRDLRSLTSRIRLGGDLLPW
jgi:hypothetical protein